MKGDQHQVKKAAEDMGDKLQGETKEQYEQVAKKIVKQGAFPKDALGLSDSMVEGIYGQAYRLYNTGKYRDAGQLFRLLIMIEPTQSKFTMGLAACLHMCKDYQAAVEAYALCSIIDPDSPIPHYHASDCYLQMKDKLSALVALEMAVKRAESREEFKTLKDRALMTIETLKKEISEGK
ncbi:MAG: SycD/LcrH family type III secretion system chaperone [Chlamydiales bacterium]|nr:SycD/LcrH family type III secretion system chaperone [Chlamydiia bacterium]MCP5507001.1 SycD/LcrH family type III secretion system chaperone [Chlamydiales bacterium]